MSTATNITATTADAARVMNARIATVQALAACATDATADADARQTAAESIREHVNYLATAVNVTMANAATARRSYSSTRNAERKAAAHERMESAEDANAAMVRAYNIARDLYTVAYVSAYDVDPRPSDLADVDPLADVTARCAYTAPTQESDPATMTAQQAYESDAAAAVRAALADADADTMQTITAAAGITYPDGTPSARAMRASVSAKLAQEHGSDAAQVAARMLADAQQESDPQTPQEDTAMTQTATQTPAPVDPQTPQEDTAMTQTATQTPAPVDPVDPQNAPAFMRYAAQYDAVCQTDAAAYSVWGGRTVYQLGTGKNAVMREVNSVGIIASPSDILPPLALTARIIGAESMQDAFSTADPAAVARIIARAIDMESKTQHTRAELDQYARKLGAAFVQVRETHDATIYTQRPMDAITWCKEVILPLLAADAAPYLMERAAVDGKARNMRTQPVIVARHVAGASFAAQRRHLLTRAEYRTARAALHRALTAARTAAQDAAAALAAADAAAALAAADAAALAANAAQDAANIINNDKAAQDAAAARKAAAAAYALAEQAAAAKAVTA